MSGEAIATAQYYEGLDAVLDRLPPKIIEIDGDVPREADADEVGGGDRGLRIERVRASLRAAIFTGKGDDKVVVGLYNEYITKIGNAMVDSGEGVEAMYEGEYNAAGEEEGAARIVLPTAREVYEGQWKGGEQEGRGTYRFADGEVYDGEWKGKRGAAVSLRQGHEGGFKKEGRGTYHLPAAGYADGIVEVGFFKADAPVGEGVLWRATDGTALRLRDGKPVEEISLEEARATVARLGLPLPEGKG